MSTVPKLTYASMLPATQKSETRPKTRCRCLRSCRRARAAKNQRICFPTWIRKTSTTSKNNSKWRKIDPSTNSHAATISTTSNHHRTVQLPSRRGTTSSIPSSPKHNSPTNNANLNKMTGRTPKKILWPWTYPKTATNHCKTKLENQQSDPSKSCPLRKTTWTNLNNLPGKRPTIAKCITQSLTLMNLAKKGWRPWKDTLERPCLSI